MNAVDILNTCQAQGVHLHLQGSDLRVVARSGRIDQQLKRLLAEHKTALVEFLQAHARSEANDLPEGEGGIVLSLAQERLWLQHLHDQDSAIYNIPLVLRSDVQLDPAILQAAVRDVLERHAPLRTVVVNDQGVPSAHLLDPASWSLEHLRTLAGDDPVHAQLAQAQTQVAFDLERDFMLRATLVHAASGGALLYLTVQHIAADGASIDVLLRDLEHAFAARSAGTSPQWQPLRHTFFDLAARQRARLAGNGLQQHLAYWQQRLNGVAPVHRLPLDHARPVTSSHAGDRYRFALDAEITARLHRLAGTQGTTLFSVIQAAYAVLIARYSDSSDVLVGTPVANREAPGSEALVGYFAQLMPVRTQVTVTQSFSDLLAAVHGQFVVDMAHHAVPTGLIVDAVGGLRERNVHPLLQLVFVYEEAALPDAEDATPAQLRRDGVERKATGSKFDLALIARRGRDGLSLAWEYASALFEQDTVSRMAANFLQLLRSIADAPEAPIHALQLLAPEERQFLRNAGTGSALQAPAQAVHALFEQHARRGPDAPALIHSTGVVTYRQLDETANALAWTLLERGVQPGDVVGVCLDHPRLFALAALAILKAGAAYLPLDPALPAARLAHVVQDSGARLWLTDSAALSAWVEPAQRLDIAVFPHDQHARRAAPARVQGGDDLAYVIYTSGSTGLPKGTLLTHAGAVNLAAAQQALLHLDDAAGRPARVLQFASLSFDAATWELLMALCSGGALVIPDPETRREPTQLAALIRAAGVTHATLPPAFLSTLADDALDGLAHLVVAGEAVGRAEARRWMHGRTLHNAYGPTETTVCATIGRYQGEARVHMGEPLPNCRCVVLDAHGSPVPLGVTGELHIGGAGLARGYHARAELDAARFVVLSVDDDAPRRWYRSGDLVRWLPSGQLEYVGRLDNQVKIRGHRVELGEVEAALCEHPDISAAHVRLRDDAVNGGTRLVVYFQQAGHAASRSDRLWLRRFLEERLPSYMVPAAYVQLDALPLNAHGKVDAAALLEPADTDLALAGHVAPVTASERLVCAVLGELLGQRGIGTADSFFALGGDSILSIRAVARINAHGHRLTSQQFFQARTVAGIASLLDAATSAAAHADVPSSGVLLPLPIQQRFLALRQGHDDRYLQSLLLHLPASADARFVVGFIAALLQRHDALRLRIGPDGSAYFVPLDSIDPASLLATVQLDSNSSLCAAQQIERAGEACKEGMRLEQASLFHAVHLDSAMPQDRRLLLVFHHFIIDGVSWRIVLDDLAQAHAQHLRGESIALPRSGTSLQRWSALVADWQGWVDAEEGRTGHAPVTADSTWTGESTAPETLESNGVVTAMLDAESTRRLLRDCNRAYRTRIDDLLLAALGIALHGWRGVTEQDVHLESHGRDETLADGIALGQCLGWFTTLHPLRLHITGDGPLALATSIMHVKESRRNVAHLGLGHLRGAALRARPEILFNYLGQFDAQMGSGRAFARAPEFTGHDVDRQRLREALLVFNGRVSDGELCFHIDFSTLRFNNADIHELAAHFEQALSSVVAHCLEVPLSRATPSDFPLCSVLQADIDQWQSTFGQIEDIYPATGSQQGMLYHAQLDAGTQHLTQNVMRFDRDFDRAAFRQAWEGVVQRHAALRTVFVGLEREQPLQLVLAQATLDWREHDLQTVAPQAQQAMIDAQLEADYRAPLDNRSAPLARFTVITLAPGVAVFAWTCSHAILDGWSLGILYGEVMEAYEGIRKGERESSVPSVGFRRYVEWIAGRNAGSAEAFWSSELEGVTLRPGIGVEHAGAVPDGQRQTLRWALDAEEQRALSAVAARHEVAISTVVQAAWLYVLARYRGSDQVVTGITLSGRPAELEGVESVVGMLVNTVPLVTRIPFDAALPEWLQDLQQRQHAREQHGHLPLARIVALSDTAPEATLFSSVLGFHSQPVSHAADALRRSGARGGVSHENTPYPLVLAVSPQDGVRFSLTGDTALFDGEALLRMQVHLQRTFRRLVLEQPGRVADLEFLDGTEEAQLQVLAEGEPLQRSVPLLPQWMVANAAVRGSETAVVLQEQRLDHAGLEARSNQIAHTLQAAGVVPGDRVGVCQSRQLDLLASVIGTMKAGAVYVPLDPGYPDERLAWLLADAGIGHVLTEAWLAAQLPLSGQHVVLVEASGDQPVHAPALAIERDWPAYMIYTSGSTGQPKGVLVEHGALADKLAALGQFYGLQPEDRGLVFASLSFDASLSQLLAPLAAGGSVALRPDEMSEPEALLAYVSEQRVSWLHVVPAYLRQLLEVAGWERTALRRVSCGGDVLDTALQQAWFAPERAGIALFNSYGPTEATITSSVQAVEASMPVVPIGRPLPGVRYWVLDAQGRVLPRGAVGELCISGSLARGYWNREEISAERFVTLTVGGVRQRLYRSGDRVRWNAQGQIEFIGRSDHQVKVRGHRIELGEVEVALLGCAGVVAAVVKAEQDALWAFVELDGTRVAEVEAALAERLPGYLLPSGYEVVTQWPLTRSGKRDRQALVRGQGSRPLRREPGNAVEQALLEIWQALLKREDIGVSDNFFQKGGHSLLATRLASQIRRRFEVDFTLKSLFELPSIEEQAALIARQRPMAGAPMTREQDQNMEEFDV